MEPISSKTLKHLCGNRVSTQSAASKFRSYLNEDDIKIEIDRRNENFIPKSRRRLRFETNSRMRRNRVLREYVNTIIDQINSSLSSLSCSESEKQEIMRRSIVFVEGDAEFRTSGPTFETQKMLFETFEDITANGGDGYGRSWIPTLWCETRCSKACESCEIEFRPLPGSSFLKAKSLVCDMVHVRGNDREKIWYVFIIIHSHFIVFDRSKSSLHIIPHHQAHATL